LGHDNLTEIEMSEAGRFRNHLFARGVSSPSVKRVFSSVRAIVNLAIREKGIAVSDVFIGTYIPEDELKQKRPPIPMDTLRQVQSHCWSLNDVKNLAYQFCKYGEIKSPSIFKGHGIDAFACWIA